MVKIELLDNGMVIFDNDQDIHEMKPELIKSVTIVPPEKNNPVFGDKFNHWRLRVHGEGYIVFETETREEAEVLLNRINEAITAKCCCGE